MNTTSMFIIMTLFGLNSLDDNLDAKILSVKEYSCEKPTDSEFNLLKEHPIVNDLIILNDNNRYITSPKYPTKLKRIKTENSELLEYTFKYEDKESFFLNIKETTLGYESSYNFFIDMPKETKEFKYEFFRNRHSFEDLLLFGEFKGLLVLITTGDGFKNGLPNEDISVEICNSSKQQNKKGDK